MINAWTWFKDVMVLRVVLMLVQMVVRGLYLAWAKDVQVNLKKFSICFIDVEIKSLYDKGFWHFTGFYGSPFAHGRNES